MAKDWKDIEGDSKEKYGLYLCSREWSELKEQVHARAGGTCERCKKNPIDAVHHLTYRRKYSELLDDLQGICDGCHKYTHGKSNVDPASTEDRKQKIKCPACGGTEVAIAEVTAVVRNMATHIYPSGTGTNSVTGNRRHYITVSFFCAQCEHAFFTSLSAGEQFSVWIENGTAPWVGIDLEEGETPELWY